ncbi:hypothetical protein, partial [Klebsiella aerogenes]|uniref:hypothetical protein n=1 Tax=Klebsiella aerogenes TaxID=548 RepID=UPI00195474EC
MPSHLLELVGEVEEGNAANVAEEGHGNEGLLAHLTEGVEGVFEGAPGVAAEAAGSHGSRLMRCCSLT